MSRPMFTRTRLLTVAGVLSLASGLAGPARGQLYTADPYDPYGRPFRSFAYPGAYDGPGGPGAGPPQARGKANQFDRFAEDLEGVGRFGRYDSKFRQFDADFDREYVPNREADARYLQDKARREQDAIRIMRETDPKLKAELRRKLEADNRKVEQDLGLSYRRGPATGPTIPAAPRRRTAGSGRTEVPREGSAVPAAPTPLSIRRAASGYATSTAGAGTAPSPRTAPSSGTPARSAPRAVPPPPPSGRAAGEPSADAPSDVLERARSLDRARPPMTSPRRGTATTSPRR